MSIYPVTVGYSEIKLMMGRRDYYLKKNLNDILTVLYYFL